MEQQMKHGRCHLAFGILFILFGVAICLFPTISWTGSFVFPTGSSILGSGIVSIVAFKRKSHKCIVACLVLEGFAIFASGAGIAALAFYPYYHYNNNYGNMFVTASITAFSALPILACLLIADIAIKSSEIQAMRKGNSDKHDRCTHLTFAGLHVVFGLLTCAIPSIHWSLVFVFPGGVVILISGIVSIVTAKRKSCKCFVACLLLDVLAVVCYSEGCASIWLQQNVLGNAMSYVIRSINPNNYYYYSICDPYYTNSSTKSLYYNKTYYYYQYTYRYYLFYIPSCYYSSNVSYDSSYSYYYYYNYFTHNEFGVIYNTLQNYSNLLTTLVGALFPMLLCIILPDVGLKFKQIIAMKMSDISSQRTCFAFGVSFLIVGVASCVSPSICMPTISWSIQMSIFPAGFIMTISGIVYVFTLKKKSNKRLVACLVLDVFSFIGYLSGYLTLIPSIYPYQYYGPYSNASYNSAAVPAIMILLLTFLLTLNLLVADIAIKSSEIHAQRKLKTFNEHPMEYVSTISGTVV